MSLNARFDVLGLGNSIVDVIATVPDDFLFERDITKGSMTLIDEERAQTLYNCLPSATKSSGGSAANTIAGIAGFGGKAAFMGKVADDELGETFAKDLHKAGVHFNVPPLVGGPKTARCLIAVTPDAQRSMSTYLGASSLFGPEDLDPDVIRASQIIYMEGYLFDRDAAKRAFVQAAEIAKAAGRKTALTLSDLFCVDRHREAFLHLIRGHVDIVFANETELLSLYQTADLEQALQQVKQDAKFALVTLSEKGSLILDETGVEKIAAVPVENVVDTTGAGDLYASGVLFGLATGMPLAACGALGSKAASEVISNFGARPAVDLRSFL